MKTYKNVILFLATMIVVVALVGCGAVTRENASSSSTVPSSSANSVQAKTFPKFQGTDFDGNAVDESIFNKRSVTVLNFWFNGCSACVDEMPTLEKLSQKLREKDAELVGVNAEAGEDANVLKEAKETLAKQNVTYKNMGFKSGEEINNYLNDIFGFPTTVLVDRNGNIVGEPILGSIDDDERIEKILKMVDDVSAGRSVSSVSDNASDDAVNALIAEENKLFSDHMDVWAKILDSIPHDKAAQMEQKEYVTLLKDRVNARKNSFTEEEMKLLLDDLEKIEAIEKKLQALNDSK